MHRFFIILLSASLLFGWGKTGHRIIGKIAEEQLNRPAQKGITHLLGHTDLARVANWPDEIKSDPSWDHSHVWHYCTIKDGQEYTGSEDGGLAIEKVQEFIEILKEGKAPREEQINALRFLVHIVGDLHQPLHVGNGSDRGGNDVRVEWFREKTNLHRVWDSQMIDHLQYSYTEYAQQLQLGMSKTERARLLDPNVMNFVYHSRSVHPQVYDIGDGKLSWEYVYKRQALMEDQLLNAGYHLAAILNDIYN